MFSIARQEALRREREINLLRVLGAGAGRIRTILILEFAILGAATALIALVLSALCSLGISWLMFDRLWQFQWQSGAFLLLAATTDLRPHRPLGRRFRNPPQAYDLAELNRRTPGTKWSRCLPCRPVLPRFPCKHNPGPLLSSPGIRERLPENCHRSHGGGCEGFRRHRVRP